jgi:hypothetical protein
LDQKQKQAKRGGYLTSNSPDVSKIVSDFVPAKIPPGQTVRKCFHPGASSMAREAISLNGSPVTSKDMLRGMMTYIWPKVCLFVYILKKSKGNSSITNCCPLHLYRI